MDCINAVTIVLILITAIICDIKFRRIPNWLNLTGLILGMAIGGFIGIQSLKLRFLGAILGLAIGIVMRAIGLCKAGDTKLICALGALVGHPDILYCVMTILVAGGIISLLFMIAKGILVERMSRLGLHLKICFLSQKLKAYHPSPKSSGEFPFSIPIACGTLVSTFLF